MDTNKFPRNKFDLVTEVDSVELLKELSLCTSFNTGKARELDKEVTAFCTSPAVSTIIFGLGKKKSRGAKLGFLKSRLWL